MDWSLATLFVVCFIVALWATPIPAPMVLAPYPDNPATIGENRADDRCDLFARGRPGSNAQDPRILDGDTEVEGKLQIGSQAALEYRPVDGKNVAIHVVVAPAAGLKAR